jgi:hypothetical protein
MSFLSRLFGSGDSEHGGRDIERALSRLEEEAANAAAGYVGTSFNKAGDLALKEGQDDRAVGYYGRAIDAFLEDGQREAARGVANKIIRVRPSAVRTLCTLTWLDLAARHQATALLHLRDYVTAAKDAAQNSRAATQIFEMAKVAPESEFVDAVADSLDSLDFSRRAEEVRGWAREGSPDVLEDSDELSDACLSAAIRSNDRDGELLLDGGAVPPMELDESVGGELEDTKAQGSDSDAPDADGSEATKSGAADDDQGHVNGKKYRWD